MSNPNPNMSGLKNFPKGKSGNPKGRPKSRVPDDIKILLGRKTKKLYLTASEIDEWELAVLSLTTNELKSLAQWENANSYAKGLAMAIMVDLKNGTTKTIDKLRERQFGKAVQKVELTGKDGADLMPARVLSKAEAKELLDSLNNEF